MTDRSKQPEIIVPDHIKLVGYDLTHSRGGVPVYRLDNPGYDVVRFSLVFRAGLSTQTQPFLASTVLNMLAEGSSRRTAKEIADFMDFYGLFYDASIDMDYAIVTVCSLEKFTAQALDLLEDLLSPAFPEYELGIYAQKRKQFIALQREKVAYLAQENFQNILYGDETPYGRIFDPNDFDRLSAETLKRFFERQYTRANLFAVVSGASSPEEIGRLGRIADRLPAGTPAQEARPAAAPAGERHIRKENSVQSAIKIGRVLFDRRHPDFIGMQVVAKVLGGYFGSRLIANLREEKGYTYGTYASLVNTDYSGYFAISGEVIAQYTEDAVREIRKEIARLRTEPVPEEELEMVKSVMIGEIMRILDGPFGVADVLIENIQNGEDNRYLNRVLGTIRRITPEEIRALAAKYLREEDLSTVIAGVTGQ